jgi:molecular chaperone GrpE
MKEKELKENQKNEKPEPAAESSKTQEQWEHLLRLKADLENTRKRLEREKLEAVKFANERLLIEILPIVDNLDRAMTSLTEGHDPEKVKKGLEIAQSEIHAVLEGHGVEVVKSVGESFNPQFHEAVGIVETADAEDGVVMDEIQRGYLLNGRLIRPSKVRIAQKKNNGTKEA